MADRVGIIEWVENARPMSECLKEGVGFEQSFARARSSFDAHIRGRSSSSWVEGLQRNAYNIFWLMFSLLQDIRQELVGC
jgi:hypothetical protein